MKRDYSEYHDQYYGTKKKSRTIFFVGFLGVLLVAFFLFIFYNTGGITGNIIGGINQSTSVKIKTSFSIPEISLNDEYEKLILYLDKGAILNIDNKKVNLEENENRIILKDFDGNVDINENYLTKLTGKVSEIRINNLPLTLQERGKLKVSLSDNSRYSFFEISEGVSLKSVFFITSGKLSFGENSLILNSEKVEINNYHGSLTIKDKKLILDGFVESLNVEGSSRKLTLSK